MSKPAHAAHRELIEKGGHHVEIKKEGLYIGGKAVLTLGNDPVDVTAWEMDNDSPIGGVVRISIIASRVDMDAIAVARGRNQVNLTSEKPGNHA
ncbi:gp38 [Corynebacterium phage BFK20]|uniref:Gp38 n=1 Tax=Corynebacterium phage BFK20 TaxID=28358 RepID=Q3V5F7_9CAUD|nr:gp38 [Corynebacterium phage BFK20]CAJ29721.1 gp38 [Corynebacterium phage BFK20]